MRIHYAIRLPMEPTMKLIYPLCAAIAACALSLASLSAPTEAFAAEDEYLQDIKVPAQDAFRKGLASALRPLPKCNPYRLLADGRCCAPGFVSLGSTCARVSPPECASVAIDNPGACSLKMCAKWVKEIKKQVPKKDEKGEVVEGEFDEETQEIACEPYSGGIRDPECALDTELCPWYAEKPRPKDKDGKPIPLKKGEEPQMMEAPPTLAQGTARWCAEAIKVIDVPAKDAEGNVIEGKTVPQTLKCKLSEEGCELVPRECTAAEMRSGRGTAIGPCKVGEYVDEATQQCTAYGCPAHCKTSDGRCDKCGPDYLGASRQFMAAYEADPHFFEAYFNEGMSLERLGEYDKAVATYEKAIAVTPRNERERKLQLSAHGFVARSKLGAAKRKEEAGDLAGAKALREDARRKAEGILGDDPDNSVALNTLALYWVENGNLEIAEDFVRRVLRVDRQNTNALNIRGLINLKQGADEIARWILEEKVLAIDPANPEALANLGLAYVRLDDLPKAVLAFERSVKLKPNSVSARLNLGAIYLEYLNYRGALQQYEAAQKLEPANLEMMTGLALSYEGAREPKKAEQLYLKVLSKDPKRAGIIIRLALLYPKAPFNDYEKAIARWKEYQKLAALPEAEAAKAAKEAAAAELKAHQKKRRPSRNAEAFDTKRAELEAKADKTMKTYKHALAIKSRIFELEQYMKLEQAAGDT